MTRPGADDELEVEQLASTTSSDIPRGPLIGVGLVLAATAIVAAVLSHPKHHHVAAPRPTPSLPAQPALPTGSPTPVTNRLSVFIEHLPGCTMSDHQREFSVAMRVINLSGRPLRLIQVRAQTDGGIGVVGTGIRIGGGACAAAGSTHEVALRPSHNVVVSLGFDLDTASCPRDAVVSGVVFFRLAGQLLHADSSTLANVRQFGFPACS